MAAKVVAIFNQKGGCAKTTTTMQLSGTLALRGFKVFVIDMDPQNTAALWSLAADPGQPFPAEVMSMAPLREGFLEKLGPLATKFDIIFIDCPPALGSRVPWSALLAADLALIPVAPVMDNVWASKQAEELVREAQAARESKGQPSGLQAAYLLSMVRRGKVFDTCLDILKAKALLPILKSKLSMRNAFPECQLYGCVASSFGKSSAADEVDAVVEEVVKLLGLKFKKVS